MKNPKESNFSEFVKGLSSQASLQLLIGPSTTVERADWITLGVIPGTFEGPPRFFDVQADGVATFVDCAGNSIARTLLVGMRILLADVESVTTDATCQLIAMW